MNQLPEQVLKFVPLIEVVLVVLLFLFGMRWLTIGRFPELGNERKLPRQLLLLGLSLAGAVVIALALPVSDSTRNQVIALIGALFTAVIAFSAKTVAENFMAGMMLRSTRPFRVGDFIRIGDHFGRVAERGLFDTEIQTEHRELIAFPNSYVIAHPVTVIRSSGAIISATLSLGYDVHHAQVESLLITAAENTGLEAPFVQIIELGNYAISYRVSGLLTDVKSILTTRSNLNRAVLDTLHADEIEIASPTLMNQRVFAEQTKFVPQPVAKKTSTTNSTPEEIVFDKAEQAEENEEAKLNLQDQIEALEIEAKTASGDDKKKIADAINDCRQQLVALESTEPKKD